MYVKTSNLVNLSMGSGASSAMIAASARKEMCIRGLGRDENFNSKVDWKPWKRRREQRDGWMRHLLVSASDAGSAERGNGSGGHLRLLQPVFHQRTANNGGCVQVYLCVDSDFSVEHNIIMSDVYPYLRKLAYIHGVNFNLSTAKFVTLDDDQDSPYTDLVRSREIRRCVERSPHGSLCFVAFLGEKYHGNLLPSTITATQYHKLLSSSSISKSELKTLKECFERDNNATKCPVYALRYDKISSSGGQISRRQLARILLKANGTAASKGDSAPAVSLSSLERQLDEVIASTCSPDNDKSTRCLVYRRAIVDILKDTKNKETAKFIDMNGTSLDRLAYTRMSEVQHCKVQQKIQLANIVDLVVNWHQAGIKYSTHRSYLQAVADHLCGRMVEMILRAAKTSRLSTADEVSQEVSHHTVLTQQYATSDMVGMEELKKRVLSYFSSHSPVDKFDKNKPLIIYSKPGCGLTTFMANLVKQMRSSTNSAVVVVRYLATSPHSETSLGILRSLALQISRAFGSNIAENLTYDLHTLCNVFQSCLRLAQRGKPLWIFLDSLHKMDATSLDNIMLWLQHAFPNRNVRLVISAVRTPKLQYLLKSFIPERNVLEIPFLRKEEMKSIFHGWLRDAGRSLTAEQDKQVAEALERRPEPLFLRCLFHECCTWRSFDELATVPCEELTSLFTWALDTHAQSLIADRALSYLTASKNGLSDNEVVDLLLCDEKLKQHPHTKDDIRWPTGFWVELRNILEPYIHDTSLGDGTITWQWSHDIFLDKARERFLASEDTYMTIYTHLARYFDGTLGRRSAQRHQKNPNRDPGISCQPIVLTPEPNDRDDTIIRRIVYNQRTLMELPWALMKSRDWQALEEILCDFTFIQAMCATGQVDVLKTLLVKACNMAIDNDFDPTTLLEFKYLISRDGHILRREPSLLTQQAANYPADSAPCRWVGQILEKKSHQKPKSNQPWLKLLNKEKIHNCEKSQIRAVHLNMRCAPVTKISLSPCGQKLAGVGQEKGKSVIKCTSTSSGNQYFTYGTEKDTIKSLSFSRDGTRIAIGTSSSILRLLDSKRGRVLKELRDDTPMIQGACIDHVTFSGNDQLVVAAYNSAKRTGCRALSVWDLNTERSEHLYSSEAEEGCYPHYGNITSLATSPNSELLASVCDQNVLRVWDLESQQCLCGVNCDGALLETPPNKADKSDGCFNALTFSCDSSKLGVTCCRGLVRIYSVARQQMGQLVGTVRHSETSRLLGAHYHYNLDNVLFTCCEKGVVKMWDVNSVELLATTCIPSGDVVKDFCCSWQGPFVCVLVERGLAHLWSAIVEDQSPNSSDPVTYATFSPSGKLIAVVHEMSNLLKIYNSDVTEALHFLKLNVAGPCDCKFSSSGDSLIVSGRSGAQICDVATGKLSAEITDFFQGSLLSAVFGSNNNTVCCLGKDTHATNTDNGFVRIFHLQTNKMAYEFSKMIGDDGSQLKVTEDGSTLACFGLDELGKETRLLFLDADEGEFIHELCIPQSANMFAVNGGFTFASVSDPKGKAGPVVQLWDVVQQLIVAEYLPYYNGVITSVAMTTDARYMLCAGKDAVHVCEIFLDDDLNGRKQMLKKSAVRRQWTADTGIQAPRKQPSRRGKVREPGSSTQHPFLGEIVDVGLFFTPTRTNTKTVGTRPASVNPTLRFVVGDDEGNAHSLELVP